MAEKHIDFKVNYRKLRIFEECNTSEIKFPMVLSAPHCGQFFPEEFLNAVKMDINELRSNEDSFVDELVRPASDAGIPMISMNINRAFVDVNRDNRNRPGHVFQPSAERPADGTALQGRVRRDTPNFRQQ